MRAGARGYLGEIWGDAWRRPAGSVPGGAVDLLVVGHQDFVLLSGTKVREMLGQGIAPPPEFSRPEVAEILMAYYQEIDGTAGN